MLFKINPSKEKGDIDVTGFLIVKQGKVYNTSNFPGLENLPVFKDLLRMGFFEKSLEELTKPITPVETAPVDEYKVNKYKKKVKRSSTTEKDDLTGDDFGDELLNDSTKYSPSGVSSKFII